MKHSEIQVGARYHAKVGNRMTIVRVESIRTINPMLAPKGANKVYRYDVRNLATGKLITFRSPIKFRTLASSLIKDQHTLSQILK